MFITRHVGYFWFHYRSLGIGLKDSPVCSVALQIKKQSREKWNIIWKNASFLIPDDKKNLIKLDWMWINLMEL
jgi:hypothetical protein